MNECGLLAQNGMNYVEDYLAHYGRSRQDGAPVGSGRYRLGSGKEPYQDYPDLRAKQQQKAERRAEKAEARQQKKAAKAQKKEESAEAKKKRLQEDLAKRKFKILRKGDIETILKNQEMFSNDELQSAVARAGLIEKLGKQAPKKDAFSGIDKLANLAERSTGWINKGAALYKAIKGVQDLRNPDTQKTIERGQKAVNDVGKKANEQQSQNQRSKPQQQTNQPIRNTQQAQPTQNTQPTQQTSQPRQPQQQTRSEANPTRESYFGKLGDAIFRDTPETYNSGAVKNTAAYAGNAYNVANGYTVPGGVTRDEYDRPLWWSDPAFNTEDRHLFAL